MAETASAFSREDEDQCLTSGTCDRSAPPPTAALRRRTFIAPAFAFAFGGATGSVRPSRVMLERAVVQIPDTETDAVAPFTILAQKRRFTLPTMNGEDPMSIRLSWRSEYPSPSK
jgi:hypothetical protein